MISAHIASLLKSQEINSFFPVSSPSARTPALLRVCLSAVTEYLAETEILQGRLRLTIEQ